MSVSVRVGRLSTYCSFLGQPNVPILEKLPSAATVARSVSAVSTSVIAALVDSGWRSDINATDARRARCRSAASPRVSIAPRARRASNAAAAAASVQLQLYVERGADVCDH